MSVTECHAIHSIFSKDSTRWGYRQPYLPSEEATLGMGHHGEVSTVLRAQGSNTVRGTVGIERVRFRRSVGVVNIPVSINTHAEGARSYFFQKPGTIYDKAHQRIQNHPLRKHQLTTKNIFRCLPQSHYLPQRGRRYPKRPR